MSNPFSLTPLHKAVIADDLEAVRSLGNKYQECGDDLGYTPLELAQFLNRQQCIELLGGLKKPLYFNVHLKEASSPCQMDLAQFEDQFNIEFTPHLIFPSYSQFRKVIAQCPYMLRNSWLAEDNYAYARQFQRQLDFQENAEVSVRWIDEDFGYGLFAEKDLAKGDFIGEYTGEVRRLSRWNSDQNGYCMHYHTKLWSLQYYVVDAMLLGNLMRFINHSDVPNLQPLCAMDRGLQHQFFIARDFIAKGTELTISYGNDYWIKRTKKAGLSA